MYSEGTTTIGNVQNRTQLQHTKITVIQQRYVFVNEMFVVCLVRMIVQARKAVDATLTSTVITLTHDDQSFLATGTVNRIRPV